MPSISSFHTTGIVVPGSKIFLCIPASASDAASVSNSNDIKTLLANGWSKFFNNGKSAFTNRPRSLPRNPLNCTNSGSWVFDSFTLTDELFAETLQRFATCLLLIIIYVENKTHQNYLSLFIADFNLLSCEFDNFTFRLSYWVILY